MEISSLLFGMIIGLAVGLSPGPLITLVISETLTKGKKEGIEVAVSVPISELPISLFALVILSSGAEKTILLGVISLLGACFLIYLGLANLRANVKESNHPGKDKALLKGITTNLLNPNAYMFWLTIGGPKVLESVHVHSSVFMFFIFGFYMMLVGSKIAVAMVVDRSRTLAKSKYYTYITRALGAVLIVFALSFVRDALEFVGIL